MSEPMSYADPAPPKDYACGECKAHGVKLWRDYGVFSPSMFCVVCCGVASSRDTAMVDNDGMHVLDGRRTDSIGWYVPAIPDEEGVGWWGYTSVPQVGINWWRALPTRRLA